MMVSNGPAWGATTATSNNFFNTDAFFSYPCRTAQFVLPPEISRRAQWLLDLAGEIEALRRKMEQTSRHELAHRIARLEGEKKLLSDRRSRARRPPARTQRKTTQRLQTVQAALDARFAAGCCR